MVDRRRYLSFADLEGVLDMLGDGADLDDFRRSPRTTCLLDWPKDVVAQWPFEHARHGPFVRDYAHIDLAHLTWVLEVVPLKDLMTLPTGVSEACLIEDYAQDPEHWVDVRNTGPHVGVREMWEAHGTWKRWPILIDRAIVTPDQGGLQVIEGRTRMGVLRGRARRGLHVAPIHLAWVARARTY